MSKVIKDDLRYLLFSEIYLRYSEPKTKRKAFAILEAAIMVYSKKGLERATLEMVAREAGITRTLIVHYFEGAHQLRRISIQYIRLLFQKKVVDRIGKETTPKEMISAYVDACFDWVETHRNHALVWLSFLHSAANSENDRALNTVSVSVGTERIRGIIAKCFAGSRLNGPEPDQQLDSARAIQVLVTGALISLATEDMPEDGKQFKESIRQVCLSFASF